MYNLAFLARKFKLEYLDFIQKWTSFTSKFLARKFKYVLKYLTNLAQEPTIINKTTFTDKIGGILTKLMSD